MTRLTLRDATIATVAYADIFEQPLTTEELGRWAILFPLKRLNPARQGSTLMRVRVAGTEYYGFRGVQRLVRARQQRIAWSKNKMLLAKRITEWFRLVPTIQLVGVTGALAMNNAKKEDDIDLFFITKRGTMWMTRLLVTVISELLGVRRRPGDTKVSNKVCLNMFMAEDRLAIPVKERDLFAAHEVLQMVALWEREGMYGKFLRANQWARRFLPNRWSQLSLRAKRSNLGFKGIATSPAAPRNDITNLMIWALRFLEPLVKAFQLWYMKRHRTTEIVSDKIIRFHPSDARGWVREALAKRLARYNIPLDKVFYAR